MSPAQYESPVRDIYAPYRSERVKYHIMLQNSLFYQKISNLGFSNVYHGKSDRFFMYFITIVSC